MFKYIIDGSGQAPTKYIEYLLKKHFGWTQLELEAESEQNIGYYINIMQNEKQRQDLDNE